MDAPYVWTEQYQTAVLELGTEDLLTQIANAELRIRHRKEELLRHSPVDTRELAAIARALQVLTLLREIGHKGAAFAIH